MAESNTKQTCSSCLFFTGSGHLGTCRRYPPTTNKSPNEWCGEHIKLIRNVEYVEPEFKSVFPIEVNCDEELLFIPKKRGRPFKK